MFFSSSRDNDKSMYVSVQQCSDETILREVDIRGLHMGVSYRELTELVSATVREDWVEVRKIVAKIARDNLGRII